MISLVFVAGLVVGGVVFFFLGIYYGMQWRENEES